MALHKDKWNSEVFLGLGSNEGDSMLNLSIARELISARIGRILNTSSIYKTEAWGNTLLNDFYNQVIQIETTHSPIELLDACQQIERGLGRRKKQSLEYENRTIDIDILFYGNYLCQKNRLILPHPHLAERNFVLMPMEEIAGELIHPVLGKSIKELLKLSKDDKTVERLVEKQ